jgi:hypothetical protein
MVFVGAGFASPVVPQPSGSNQTRPATTITAILNDELGEIYRHDFNDKLLNS